MAFKRGQSGDKVASLFWEHVAERLKKYCTSFTNRKASRTAWRVRAWHPRNIAAHSLTESGRSTKLQREDATRYLYCGFVITHLHVDARYLGPESHSPLMKIPRKELKRHRKVSFHLWYPGTSYPEDTTVIWSFASNAASWKTTESQWLQLELECLECVHR